ncbi:hypothetical protein LOK49_LG13G01848 [Camellia lanceoleosa]|uniref:Uncharacterized protein n=1 Tax=Camellia lanceoleosa TaxID=1840588 RepID=A0ACC0FMA7_9ERIC|nr:hypothetical protein LOK49_LG13G01848 [Camellia lanceoleosa]
MIEGLRWYDTKRETFKKVIIYGIQEFEDVNMCLGSLVSLNGGSESDGKKQEEPEEGNRILRIGRGIRQVLHRAVRSNILSKMVLL